MVRVLAQFPWGYEVISMTEGHGGASPQTTTYIYYTNASVNYGRLQLMQAPDGSWTRHEYDGAGARQ